MSDNLELASTPTFVTRGEYDVTIPDGWQQGRGAFGGLVMAMLVRALEHHVAAPDRPLRSLTGEIPAPAVLGPARVRVEVLREGQGITCAAARLVQEGTVRAHAVGVFGRARGDEPPMLELAPPPSLAWREMAVAPMDFGAPTFTQFLEFRVDPAFAPFASGSASRAEGWVRARKPGAMPEAAHLAALIDAWWPAIFHRMPAPRPIATITYTLHIAGTLAGLDPDAPFFHRARALVTSEGYSMELRELWGADGRLLAVNPQTVAIIK